MDSNKIDLTYSQEGGVCVFASYAIIMNCFSKGQRTISDLINSYVQKFNTKPSSKRTIDVENSIQKHYFGHCVEYKLRGFNFIANCHNSNFFDTQNLCSIVSVVVNRDQNPLSCDNNKFLKDRLLLNTESLAMVLIDEGNHTIVVGYNEIEKSYFFRNPTSNDGQVLTSEDILATKEIYEFILFENL